MEKIKILSNNLINQIAAGEVLERPVSAVKELVENSIDANSKKIDIFIRDGGRTEITVIDNGDGIREDELELSLQRHATSKLNSSNLEKISTLGFRGEALPSIASVSEMIIRSNTNSDQLGKEIKIVYGNVKSVKPVNQKKGTFISVKNLFFSTPARLKFLKSENYESLLIKRIIQKFAISNHKIEFNLFINQKKIINLGNKYDSRKGESFSNRVSQILGEEFLENCIKLNKTKDSFLFSGLLGLPTYNYSNSNNQFIFVNKRIINDKSLNTIFKLAYRDFMSYDRFPQLILFIECPFEEIDINVHPAKTEIRFKDINKLRSYIISSFKNTISSAGHKSSTVNTSRAIKRFSNDTNFQKNLELKDNKSIDYFDENDKKLVEQENKSNSKYTKFYPLGFAKSQFHNTYILSQTEKGIVIIDQHAAHERIVYEKLKNDYYNKEVKTQILLIPEIIDVEKSVLASLNGRFDIAERYGLKMEAFGGNSVIVREIPGILSDCNIKELTKDLINELIEFDDSSSIEKQINSICSTMSCHGSIRAGREMQVDEMNDLLRRMENTPFSGQCNHGRPTYVELNICDIEKLFGRK